MSNFIVGLTGGIGSGKTTVANLFAQQGITLVDADVIAREIVAPNSPCLNKIIDRFGTGILLADGNLDRAKLREIIFSDDLQKNWLNALLHPQIRQQMMTQCKAAQSAYVILVVPLLVENQLFDLVDRLLVVDVNPATQIERTVLRDKVDERQVNSILQSQATRDQRLAVADDVINNEVSEDNLSANIIQLHKKYLQLAKLHANT